MSVSGLRMHARRARHYLKRVNPRLLHAYLQSTEHPRLQIGGGCRLLDGWLNADIEVLPGVFRMDAAQPFPFENEQFEYVFVEHMIEHIDYPSGLAMLRECRRVLRPGGAIRVVTPDLAALGALFQAEGLTGVREEYYAYFRRTLIGPDLPQTRASVADALFRSWGHRYIYDEETLRLSLEAAGFFGIERRRLGDSGFPELAGLENEGRYPPGLLDYESVALEASR